MSMRLSLMRTMLLFVPLILATLVISSPTVASEDLQSATLTCSDGTNLNLALDAASVTQLTDAVNAIALNPAGDPPLTCSVATSPLLQSSASSSDGNPTYDYAVGGGKAPNLGCPDLPTSFGLSAHVRKDAPPETASGTFNVGSPGTNRSFGCQGHLNSKVDCLVVAD